MTDEQVKIDFERAELDGPAADRLACGLCTQAIEREYWQALDKVLCQPCSGGLAAAVAAARGRATFWKAFALAGVVAFGGGIAYAIFVGLTNIQFALVTIGIGWAVARAIQKVTGGFGSRKHQILAVALTYFASTMGYVPAIFEALGSSAESASAPAADTPPPRVPEPEPAAAPNPVVAVVVALVVVVALMLAAPFLDVASGFGGVLGLLIIFFGLRTAWRTSQGIEPSISGPHKLGSPAAA